jgi:hypothetical protein
MSQPSWWSIIGSVNVNSGGKTPKNTELKILNDRISATPVSAVIKDSSKLYFLCLHFYCTIAIYHLLYTKDVHKIKNRFEK